MLPLIMPWLPLAVKLLLTAAIVTAASVTTERAGPFIGGLVISLPVTIWPAYLFLTLDHDAAFVASSAVAGLVMNAATAVLMLVYVLMAQRFWVGLGATAAVAAWVMLGIVFKTVTWSFPAAVLLNAVAYSAALWLARPYRDAPIPKVQRRWYDIPARVLFICVLMGVVLGVSTWAGPVVTGFIAVFPMATLSAALILNPRIGNRGTAAMVATSMRGMVGVGLGLCGLHLTIVPFGPVAGLGLMLVLAASWNLMTWVQRMRQVPARS